MSYQTITYALENDIATISLNRPEVMNSLNTQMRAEITHAVEKAQSEARVIVLTGNGRAFCAGQDIGGDMNAAELDLARVLLEEYEPMLRAIFNCRIPTVCAVNGTAAGAGANLALACDIVIATESAVFVQAFSRIGLIPDAGGTYWLPRQMGFAKAMGAALLAEKITARQADEWGMIWESVADAQFHETVQARATHLANGPTRSYRYIKQAMRQSFDNTMDQQLTLEAELQGKAGKTRDFLEGVLSFQEKRPSKFEGR